MVRKLLLGCALTVTSALAAPITSHATPSNGSLLVPGDLQPGNYWATPVDSDGGYVEVCSDYQCDIGTGLLDNYVINGRTMIVIPYNAQMVNVTYASLSPANVPGGMTLPIPRSSAPSDVATTSAPPDEQRFLEVANTLPMYLRHSRYGGDPALLDQGYRACEALDQYPSDASRATRVIYPNGNTIDGEITMDGDMFMLYASSYLCPRHSHLYENY